MFICPLNLRILLMIIKLKSPIEGDFLMIDNIHKKLSLLLTDITSILNLHYLIILEDIPHESESNFRRCSK